jgi:hypothetical protein
MLSFHLRLGPPSGLLPSGLPTKMLYAPLTSPMRVTCPAHLILLALITLTILGEEYKPCSSSFRTFLQPPVTSSLLGPNIFSAPCSQISSIYVLPLTRETRFHTHTKPQLNYIFVYFNLHITRQQTGKQKILNWTSSATRLKCGGAPQLFQGCNLKRKVLRIHVHMNFMCCFAVQNSPQKSVHSPFRYTLYMQYLCKYYILCALL